MSLKTIPFSFVKFLKDYLNRNDCLNKCLDIITGKEQNIYGKLKCKIIEKKIEQKAVFTNFTCRVFQSFLSRHTAHHTLNGELAMPVGICRYLIMRSPAMFTTERDS